MTLENLEYELQKTLRYMLQRLHAIAGTDLTNVTLSSVKKELDELKGIVDGINSFEIKIVEKLPEDPKTLTLYFVKEPSDKADDDAFKEYMWIDETWEYIGSTRIDLSNYVQRPELDDYAEKTELHEHSNKIVLDLIGQTADGLLAFQGKMVRHEVSKDNSNILELLSDGLCVKDEAYTDAELQSIVDEINKE